LEKVGGHRYPEERERERRRWGEREGWREGKRVSEEGEK
jgi:hypothetical protein